MNLSENYRPQALSDLIGQPRAVKVVERIAQRAIGGRAFWISGATSIGKTTLARIIAGVIAQRHLIVEYDSADKFKEADADRLHRAGADLVSLTESIDTTTAAGKMVFRMLAVLAAFERDLVSERTTAALAHKRGKGERVGTIPYGWRLVDDGVTLEPVESEQAVVREIAAMRADRASYRAIVDELTRRGVPTKIGGAVWTHQTVASILRRVASATLWQTERGS